MPVVKASEALPERPIVVVIYGEPGVCKTSLLNSCDNPLLIDFDRGVDRSFGRKDTLVPQNWQEVLDEESAGTFANYNTIGIDTAKACLDDFLMVHVVEKDYKLATNKLKAYGEIGDQFKLFVNKRRSEKADIVIIAHAKKDEDTKKHIPDVTGQSYALIMRIADQVGYVSMQNGKRVITFEPTDLTVGKNVAALPSIEIPDKGTPEFKIFGGDLISKIRTSVASMSEEQREALEKSEKYQGMIADAESVDDIIDMLPVVEDLPDYLRLPLNNVVYNRIAEFIQGTETPESLTHYIQYGTSLPDYLKEGFKNIISSHAKKNGWEYKKEKNAYEVKPVVNAESETVHNSPTFNKQYDNDADLLVNIELVQTKADLVSLYNANTERIENTPEISIAFANKQDEISKATKAGKGAKKQHA